MLPISLITNVGSTVYVGKLWTNCSRLKQYQESRSGCWSCFPKDHSVTYLKVVDRKFACIRCVFGLAFAALRFSFYVFSFFFFFFFSRFFPPHKRLLFMYCTWTVAATFDQFYVNSAFVHCLRTHKFHFLSIFSLKMGPTVLFTHLKIILLQWF